MLLRTDIAEILEAPKKDPGKAVWVVKHDYEPKDKIKYLDTVQYNYPRKNWSSVVLWDCGHEANKVVTPSFVNTADPAMLHRFKWLEDDQIGELDVRWNWLVGEYANPPSDVKNVHWTNFGPWLDGHHHVDFSDEWFNEREMMNYAMQASEVRGKTA